MPIYSKKLTSVQYKVVTKIDVKEFKKLLDIFKKAKTTFPYNNKIPFLKSIELDEAGKSLEFYDAKELLRYVTGIDLMDVDGKFPFISKFYNDPRLNITDYNYTLMMESLINEANNLLSNKYSKYLYDIAGSWTNGKVILLEKK